MHIPDPELLGPKRVPGTMVRRCRPQPRLQAGWAQGSGAELQPHPIHGRRPLPLPVSQSKQQPPRTDTK